MYLKQMSLGVDRQVWNTVSMQLMILSQENVLFVSKDPEVFTKHFLQDLRIIIYDKAAPGPSTLQNLSSKMKAMRF